VRPCTNSLASAKVILNMALKFQQSLQGLKATSLRHLLNSIGSKQSGNKAQLAERLGRDLAIPKLSVANDSANKLRAPRILSIDMGIKNLAYCLGTVDLPKSSSYEGMDITKPSLHVSAWERVGVLEDTEHSTSDNLEENDLYSPAALAPVALRLVRSVFLPLQPTVILIERQRFRSGGAAAVQEWTLRVNTLEAMLWAVLGAMREHSAIVKVPPVYAVSPSQVASFWVPGERKVQKQDKINIVKGWLQGNDTCPELDFDFDHNLAVSVESFANKRDKTPKNASGSISRRQKLDDLADSLLQAAAWVIWEVNRRRLHGLSAEEMEKVMPRSQS
jgi:cruciform cutting endonuclease 1